ncbi:MAG: YciI family protein [Opitutaceae bacterium]
MKLLFACLLFFSAFTMSADKPDASANAAPKPQTFDYEWGGQKMTMQQYFIVFLKSGPNRSQSKEDAVELQKQHLAYLGGLYEKGIIQLNGPTNGEDDIRGFSVYATATKEEAQQLANEDPMVKAGRLVIEVRAWWLAKGSGVK